MRFSWERRESTPMRVPVRGGRMSGGSMPLWITALCGTRSGPHCVSTDRAVAWETQMRPAVRLSRARCNDRLPRAVHLEGLYRPGTSAMPCSVDTAGTPAASAGRHGHDIGPGQVAVHDRWAEGIYGVPHRSDSRHCSSPLVEFPVLVRYEPGADASQFEGQLAWGDEKCQLPARHSRANDVEGMTTDSAHVAVSQDPQCSAIVHCRG